MELERREAEAAKARGESQSIGFGSQIRSYVVHPYTMVKDLRTGHETGNAQGVLDGDLDGFIRAELERRARGGAAVGDTGRGGLTSRPSNPQGTTGAGISRASVTQPHGTPSSADGLSDDTSTPGRPPTHRSSA